MPSRKYVALIVHGARADRADLRHMVSWVRDKGHLVDVHPTFERGDAMALARDAATRGADVVAVAGGDGTVNEVVNGLDGFETALGVLPFGTANDFARQAGIPADADLRTVILVLLLPQIPLTFANSKNVCARNCLRCSREASSPLRPATSSAR